MNEDTEEHDGPSDGRPDGPDLPEADTSTVLGWRAVVFQRWNALGREVLGLEEGRLLALAEIGRECDFLASIVAWFQNGGNITYAAAQLGTSRRALRNRITVWRQDYPEFVPQPATIVPAGARSRCTADALEPTRPDLHDGDDEPRPSGDAP